MDRRHALYEEGVRREEAVIGAIAITATALTLFNILTGAIGNIKQLMHWGGCP